jgi:hypothetical protein
MNNLADMKKWFLWLNSTINEVENKKVIKKIQEKLYNLVYSLNTSVNLTRIKDLEKRGSSLEDNVEKILNTLDLKKIE